MPRSQLRTTPTPKEKPSVSKRQRRSTLAFTGLSAIGGSRTASRVVAPDEFGGERHEAHWVNWVTTSLASSHQLVRYGVRAVCARLQLWPGARQDLERTAMVVILPASICAAMERQSFASSSHAPFTSGSCGRSASRSHSAAWAWHL